MEFRKVCAILVPLVILAVSLLTAAASYGVTVLSDALTPSPPQRITVVIDPGHGGEDGGALSCTGVRESVLNLAVASRLEDLLLLFGLQTRMTRREDIAVCDPGSQALSEKKVSDLRNRVRMVSETEGPVLISIHQNTFPEEKWSGAQVFYADTDGSLPLAEGLQRILREALDPANHREAKKSLKVYLMNHIQCPGVLIECGFLSNPREEALLRTDEYQKKLACAVAGGLSQYLIQTSHNRTSAGNGPA